MMLDRLKAMLKRHEGWKLKRYRCPAGHWTIGAGWNLDAHRPPEDIAAYLRIHGEITEEMAERLLDISATAAIRSARGIWAGYDGFTETRQLALADFVFNLGPGGVMKFKRAVAAINDGDWWKAADEMKDSDWFRQVGERGETVVKMVREG